MAARLYVITFLLDNYSPLFLLEPVNGKILDMTHHGIDKEIDDA